MKVKGAGEALSLRVTGTKAVPIRSMRFKGLLGTATVDIRYVAYHWENDLFIQSLDYVKKYISALILVFSRKTKIRADCAALILIK